MNFTDQMKIVMEAIFVLRGGKRNKILVELRVHEYTKLLMSDENGVPHEYGIGRNNWARRNAGEEWKAIKEAIKANLPQDHPVELEIAKFGKFETHSFYQNQIKKLQYDLEIVENKFKSKEKELDEYKQSYYSKHFEDNRYRLNCKKMEIQLNTLVTHGNDDKTTIQKYQIENAVLSKENAVLKKRANGATELIHPPFLYQADMKKIDTKLSNIELYSAYQYLRDDAMQSMLKEMSKNEKHPQDVFLIFHEFNTEIEELVDNYIPFKEPHNNYVFSCFAPLRTFREQIYKETAKFMPLPPTVIFVTGNMVNSNLTGGPGFDWSKDVNGRMRLMMRELKKFNPYAPIEEGFEKLYIRR